jgi:hypothetical protein
MLEADYRERRGAGFKFPRDCLSRRHGSRHCEDARSPLVLELVALAANVHSRRAVEQAVDDRDSSALVSEDRAPVHVDLIHEQLVACVSQ